MSDLESLATLPPLSSEPAEIAAAEELARLTVRYAGAGDRLLQDAVVVEPERLARKRFATVRAKAAIAGFSLNEIQDADGRPQLIVSRWNLCRAFDDLADVEAFLVRVSGERA